MCQFMFKFSKLIDSDNISHSLTHIKAVTKLYRFYYLMRHDTIERSNM